MGVWFGISLFNVACLYGSRKGLAEEREAGNITDGRKREEKKEEGNEVQSLDDGQQREATPSSWQCRWLWVPRCLWAKDGSLEKIQVDVPLESLFRYHLISEVPHHHLLKISICPSPAPSPTFSPWLQYWTHFPAVNFFIYLLSVTSQKNVSSTKSKVLSLVHCCISRSQKYPLLTEGAQ